MGYAPIFAIVIVIPIQPIEMNRNRNHNRIRVINRRCESSLMRKSKPLSKAKDTVGKLDVG